VDPAVLAVLDQLGEDVVRGCDESARFIFVSEVPHLGYSPAQARSLPIQDVVHPVGHGELPL